MVGREKKERGSKEGGGVKRDRKGWGVAERDKWERRERASERASTVAGKAGKLLQPTVAAGMGQERGAQKEKRSPWPRGGGEKVRLWGSGLCCSTALLLLLLLLQCCFCFLALPFFVERREGVPCRPFY